MQIRKIILSGILLVAILVVSSTALTYEVPYNNSKVKYFYVFGPDGDPKLGAEDHKLTLFFDIPEYETNDLVVSVYDPNTMGMRDWKEHPDNIWDTVTEFSIYGKELLDKKEFSNSKEYDRKYFKFGPYSKTLGEKTGKHYRFKLLVKATNGDDANLFNVKVSPETVETFSYNITFRLLPREKDKMYFYPEILPGANQITIKNYDLDRDGGISKLHDYIQGKYYRIKDSKSGEWSETIVPLIESKYPRRLKYTIEKLTQRQGHAGLEIRDNKGRLIPIYFKKAPFKYNIFIFDARESYDPDNQNLSFFWNLGDGNTSTEPLLIHEYEKDGEYEVVLTVKDNSGLHCDTTATSEIIRVFPPSKK